MQASKWIKWSVASSKQPILRTRHSNYSDYLKSLADVTTEVRSHRIKKSMNIYNRSAHARTSHGVGLIQFFFRFYITALLYFPVTQIIQNCASHSRLIDHLDHRYGVSSQIQMEIIYTVAYYTCCIIISKNIGENLFRMSNPGFRTDVLPGLLAGVVGVYIVPRCLNK